MKYAIGMTLVFASALSAQAARPVAGLKPPTATVGSVICSTSGASTGEKPQSKIWYADGSYWCIVRGPNGVAFYEKNDSSWVQGKFNGAILQSSGTADVKWNGTTLFVLMYSSTSKLYEYTYNATQRIWVPAMGFPVAVPTPSGSETMVLEQDSRGRLWTAVEGQNSINVYYSTSEDHRTWIQTPVVLQTGVDSDDICSIVAFAGNRIGVFWSDQKRDEFGFRIHDDSDAPTAWSLEEVVYAGSGHADDHIDLAFDSMGRVYAITKDDFDRMALHRRGVNGGWTTKTNVSGGDSTRGIVMVAEQDSRVYVLYTCWDKSPNPIHYRMADIETLDFGGETTFITSSKSMNDVTGMKQLLPAGALIAAASNGKSCLFNSFGNPPAALLVKVTP
ncbi:MAG: hypothetical protein NTW75_00530 [Planctomycetales bacterium]|nr:hypothetical protein [Planctomycetales bacterium]